MTVVRRTATALAIAALAVLAIIYVPAKWFVPITAFLAALAIVEYALLLRRKIRGLFAYAALLALGAAVLVCALSALPAIASKSGNLMLLYTVAIVKISDMGGFAFGLSSARLMKGGNHKLCPSVSPNKSWEGLFGSLFGSCLVSCCFMPVTGFSWGRSLAFGIVAALLGTLGDLAESKFKRWAGVKDSSAMRFTNGMGGILDMLDSLLIAPSAILAFF